MRYKIFEIVAEVGSYEMYGENGDLPELVNIEVDITYVGPKPNPKRFKFERETMVAEDHPNFNFDLWANKIDTLDEHYDEADRDFRFGTERLNNFILKHFPTIHVWYKDYELI